jgi:hypothetical protein
MTTIENTAIQDNSSGDTHGSGQMPTFKEFGRAKMQQGLSFLGNKTSKLLNRAALEKDLLKVKSELNSTVAKEIGRHIIMQIEAGESIELPVDLVSRVHELIEQRDVLMEDIRNA